MKEEKQKKKGRSGFFSFVVKKFEGMRVLERR
jgi:hypothetical protein